MVGPWMWNAISNRKWSIQKRQWEGERASEPSINIKVKMWTAQKLSSNRAIKINKNDEAKNKTKKQPRWLEMSYELECIRADDKSERAMSNDCLMKCDSWEIPTLTPTNTINYRYLINWKVKLFDCQRRHNSIYCLSFELACIALAARLWGPMIKSRAVPAIGAIIFILRSNCCQMESFTIAIPIQRVFESKPSIFEYSQYCEWTGKIFKDYDKKKTVSLLFVWTYENDARHFLARAWIIVIKQRLGRFASVADSILHLFVTTNDLVSDMLNQWPIPSIQ